MRTARLGDVVNPNGDSVYQSEAILTLTRRVTGAAQVSGARRNSEEYVDVQKAHLCVPRERIFRCRDDSPRGGDRCRRALWPA